MNAFSKIKCRKVCASAFTNSKEFHVQKGQCQVPLGKYTNEPNNKYLSKFGLSFVTQEKRESNGKERDPRSACLFCDFVPPKETFWGAQLSDKTKPNFSLNNSRPSRDNFRSFFFEHISQITKFNFRFLQFPLSCVRYIDKDQMLFFGRPAMKTEALLMDYLLHLEPDSIRSWM